MQAFLEFFEHLTSAQKLIWILICLSFSWIGEAIVPLVKLEYKKWKHAGVNLVFLVTSILINVFFGIVTVGIFNWLSASNFGILNWISLPTWLGLILSVMLLDFVAQYVVHYLLHRVSWMWKFHMIHHSDTKVDATTGTRHHPGDYILRELFALGAIIIVGMPIAFYLVYRVCSVFFTYFSHANISLPIWLDKMLSLVVITPNMHKFHHHFERPWTDTNFGNIFSIWDRIFGTLVYDDPKKVKYGLDVVDGSKDENIAYQFKLPFDKSIKTDY